MKKRFHSLTMRMFIFLLLVAACSKEDAVDPLQPNQPITPSPPSSPNPPTPPVDHVAPIAQAGNDTTLYSPFSSTTLNGGASTGSIVSYTWRLVKAPSQVEVINYGSHSKPKTFVSRLVSTGSYEFELIVTDSYNLTSRDTVKVTVAEPNCTTDLKEVIIKDVNWSYAWWMQAGIANVFSYLPENSYIRNFYIRRDASDQWELILPYDHNLSKYGTHYTWEHVEYFEFETWYLLIYPTADTRDDTPDVKIEYCN